MSAERFVTSRWWTLWTPVAVVIAAAILRLWNLAHPQALVFDETYYVKDGYSLYQLGYEGVWDGNANPGFENGDTSGLSQDGSFVVHPPLGKWLIGLGMAVFGQELVWTWRLTTALAGTALVALTMVLAKRLWSSTFIAVTAGVLIALDGNAIVMSRVAILDTWLALFLVLGVMAVVQDRQSYQRRSNNSHAIRVPFRWWRPWILLAGVAFGAALSVKWSALWFIAAYGLWVVISETIARHRAGEPRATSRTLFLQGPVTAVWLLVPAGLTYLASWTGWIVTSGGWGRNWAVQTGYAGPLPEWLASLIEYHRQAFEYHTGLVTPHSYQANPLTWLFMIRPTSMYYQGSANGENGCEVSACSEAITAIGNPLLWWVSVPVLIFLVFRYGQVRERSLGVVLLGVAAGWLPWMLTLHRTVFEFYVIAFTPFLVIAVAYTLRVVLAPGHPDADRRQFGVTLVVGYLVLLALVALFFLPLYTAMQIPQWYWQAHIWLPSWR